MQQYDAFILNVLRWGFYGETTHLLLSHLPIRSHMTVSPELCHKICLDPSVPSPSELPEDIITLLRSCLFQAVILRNAAGQFIIIEFSDGASATLCSVQKTMPNFVGAMVMQYDMFTETLLFELQEREEMHVRKFYESRKDYIVPGYFSRNVHLPLPTYQGTLNKLIFAGTIHDNIPERQVLHILKHHPDFTLIEGTIERPSGINIKPFSHVEMCNQYHEYRGMLGLRGTAKFCFREFDALAGGYPLFMHPLNYTSQMEPLINNEHYFAIDFDPTPEIFAQRIMDRFYAVRGNEALLNRVRLNGQAWFERNAALPSIIPPIKDWVEKTLPL